jgi:glyoxylase-like metal-dependent hydrolase (beta-lactamase superfamily II)
MRLLLSLCAVAFPLRDGAIAPSSLRDNTTQLTPSTEDDCLRFYDLNRLCLPQERGLPVIEAEPNEECPRGYYSTQTIDVRVLFDDTILLKETGDPLGEAPVMTLFLGDESALLLDSGNGSVDIHSAIAPLIQSRRVTLLNTHLHGDHIANNPSFDVFAIDTPEVRAHCQLRGEDFSDESALCKTNELYTPPQDQTLFGSRSFRVERVLRDGYRLLLDGRVLEVLVTPGHSETSIALYDPRHQLLFTGDTLYPGANPPLIHPQIGSSFAAYLETARRLSSYADTRLVIGAHGEGLMPHRVLKSFVCLVEARWRDPENSADFIDDDCSAADWVMGNDPSR